MITYSEMRQRLAFNRMTFLVIQGGEFRVNFMERDVEATAYYTDDRDDAVLTGAAMRRRKDQNDAKLMLAMNHLTAA